MEFANRCDPAQKHFEERHARSLVDDPRAKAVLAASTCSRARSKTNPFGAALRCSVRPRRTRWKACEWPLISPGKMARPDEPLGFGKIGRLARKSSDVAAGIGEHRQAGLNSLAGKNQVWKPTGLGLGEQETSVTRATSLAGC